MDHPTMLTWALAADGQIGPFRFGGGDSAGNIVPEALFGTTLRHALGDQIGRQLQFAMEQPTDRDNRVTIDDRFATRWATHVKEGIVTARHVATAIYGELGAQEHTDHSPRDGVAPLGYNGAGTHIMGDDPTSSVVDSFQRCWDHPNLYAVGCGSMPSMGTSNPSLTMAALALRSAEQIHRDLVALHRPVEVRP